MARGRRGRLARGMARKLRLEFPGAIYHVINRGNYRRWIFEQERTQAAFERCLFEAVERNSWLLRAFVIMGNHYHLALETPEGNLVSGMQWLQATFANRFNRFRDAHGHLFQGRYKSLLLENGEPLGQVCHYIHLNPVRAGVLPVERLPSYRYGSYWYLHQPARRPPFLRMDAALAGAGGLSDSAAGRRSYQSYLEWQAVDGPAGKTKAYVNLSHGWAIGSREFKAALVEEHKIDPQVRALEAQGADEVRELRWEKMLRTALGALQKTGDEVIAARKSARWKLAVANWMKTRTPVSNPWLAIHLNLGAPAALSRNLTLYRRIHRDDDPEWRRLISISAA